MQVHNFADDMNHRRLLGDWSRRHGDFRTRRAHSGVGIQGLRHNDLTLHGAWAVHDVCGAPCDDVFGRGIDDSGDKLGLARRDDG